jgi:serine/threonine-protein kinase
MLRDLEDVLAIEAARSGQATGEVTSVLRSLPGDRRRRLPMRTRHPLRWMAGLTLLLAAAIAGALLAAAGNTHRGTGATSAADGGLHAVPLAASAAHGYNPFGTGPEDRDQVPNLVDDDPNTTWSTEQYYDGTLRKPGGTGTGVYLDAAPGVAARALEVQTPTPGFAAQVYVADRVEAEPVYGSSTPLTARGWHGPVGTSASVRSGHRIRIAVAHRYRYYLLWITALPPHGNMATLAGITLLR